MTDPEHAHEDPEEVRERSIRWLGMINREEYADKQITLRDGRVIDGDMFSAQDVCGHAGVIFVAIEAMPDDDPDKTGGILLAQETFDDHFGDHISGDE